MLNLYIYLLIFLLYLCSSAYYVYIFSRFKRLRLKKWFFNELWLQRRGSRLVIKCFLRKITFTYVIKESNKNIYLKYRFYHRLRWRRKPSISSVIFANKNLKTIVVIVSFR